MRDICKTDGLTTAVSLHQVSLAREFADRIIGLRGGRVVFDGSPDALTAAVVADLYRTGADAHDADSRQQRSIA